MRSNRTTDLKVGITVLIGLAVLVFGIGWAKSWHFGGKPIILHAHFTTAGGIEKGDPVFVRGLKDGVVTEILSTPGKDVFITMELTQHELLHRDALASIMMLELMGGKKIDIGIGSVGAFDYAKDTLPGVFTGDLSSLVATINSLSGSLPSITKKVDSVLGSISDFFGNGAFKEKIYITIEQAGKALADFRAVLGENRTALKHTIDQAEQLSMELNNTVISIRPGALALVDSMRSFVRGAERTLSGADSLLGSLNEMMAAAKDKKSLLYRLTSDKEMAERFDSLMISGHKLIEQLRLKGLDANIRFFNSASPSK